MFKFFVTTRAQKPGANNSLNRLSVRTRDYGRLCVIWQGLFGEYLGFCV